MDRGLAVVRHEADERGVPLVGDLRKRGAAAAHEDLPHAVLKRLHRLVAHPEKRLHAAHALLPCTRPGAEELIQTQSSCHTIRADFEGEVTFVPQENE